MNNFTLKFWLVLGSMAALINPLYAAQEAVDAAPVPEPSVAVLGGLCGILFLFWRRK